MLNIPAARDRPRHEARLVQAQPPVGIVPCADPGEGILQTVARLLRLTPGVDGNVLFNALVQHGDGPRGLRQPADDALRRHDPEARPAPKIERRRRRAVEATGKAAPDRRPPDMTAQNGGLAEAELRHLFGAGRDGSELVRRLMRLSTLEAVPREQPVLVGTVLARMTSGDARAATRILDGLFTAEPQGAAFAAQLALSRCGGPGVDCLQALDGVRVVDGDANLAAIRREAYTARLRAANRLCDLLAPDLRPRSLAACVTLARRAVERGGAPPDLAIIFNGLLCAHTLAEDPSADAPQQQREAYLAVRNDIFGKAGLEQMQHRLYKTNTYIQRASERGAARFGHAVSRVFGHHKSPLHALAKLGTAQSKTRHPSDDLAVRCVAMDALVAAVEAQLAGRPMHVVQDDETLRKSIRVALVRHWKRSIVDKGWHDRLHVGRRMRASVAADVVAQLGCPAETVLQHAALRGTQVLVADQLPAWARQESLDHDAPVRAGEPRSLGEALKSFRQMQHGGDTIIRRPTPAQTRELLHDAIEGTRQTYSVTFNQGNTVGVQVAMNDILALTPAVFGVGPNVGLTGSRGGFVQTGSTVNGGQFVIGSQRGGHAEAGVSGFIGKKLEGVVNLGFTGNATVAAADYTYTLAAAVRTRMNVFGSDQPDAWRQLLMQVVDTLTWEDGGEGPPTGPAQMWAQLARRFYKNPNLSIDDLHSHLATAGGSATATLGARVVVPLLGVQIGPSASVGGNKVYRNLLRQRDVGANRTTEQNVESASRAGAASIGLTGLAPGIVGGAIHDNAGHAGSTQSITMSSANLGSRSVSFLRSAAGVTLRLVTDQGRVDADYSVMDTETGTAEAFATYIDSQRADWLESLGGGAVAEHDLDVFLTRVVNEETRGNVTYGERRRMTPVAARRIDYFRAMAAAVADTASPADRSAVDEVARLEGEVSKVLGDPASWDPRSMWVLDLNQESHGKGPATVVHLNSRITSSSPRQRNVIIAPLAPRRAAAEHADF